MVARVGRITRAVIFAQLITFAATTTALLFTNKHKDCAYFIDNKKINLQIQPTGTKKIKFILALRETQRVWTQP